MIIDVHVHLLKSHEVIPRGFLENLYRIWEDKFGKEGMEERKALLDGRVEPLINDMDEAGVDKSIVCPADLGLMCKEEPKISIWENNEYIAESQRKYPNRIIGFVGVDPLRKDAVELLEKGITEWGLQGVGEFFPSVKITDERIQPFLEKVNELELPVLLHQGMDPIPYLIKYGNPIDLNALTLRYPKMKIIAAHVARGFDELLTEIMTYSAGQITTDISQFQHLFLNTHWHFIMKMRYIMDRIPSLVLMASDWPFVKAPPLPTHKEWFDIIRNLKMPEQVLQLGLGVKDFTQQEKDLILGENAKRFLGIE
jgi:hypothetical protein